MTSQQQTPEVNLLDAVVFVLLEAGWVLLGRSYDGVAVERGGLTVELRPDNPAHGGGLSVSTLNGGFNFLGHAHSAEGVLDLVALRHEIRMDPIRRQANIDLGKAAR